MPARPVNAKSSLHALTLTATFCAVTAIATMLIQIPSPMNGYVNMGDCFVLLSAWMLGPIHGTAAAAVGSALADIISGYLIYAPATLVIKGLMALAAYAVFGAAQRVGERCRARHVLIAVSAVCAEVIMTVGYFAYAAVIFGEGLSAVASISGNLVQGVFGAVSAYVLRAPVERLLSKIHLKG